MPELPEVETIKRGLAPRITGRMLTDVAILEPKTAHFLRSEFDAQILHHKVAQIRRRAKVLIWDFEGGSSLLFHLKMTGQVIILEPEGTRFGGGHPTPSMVAELPDKSTRLYFDFDDGTRVFFNDQRKFGWVKLLPTAAVENETFLAKVGPEPLESDFTPEYFRAQLKKRNAPIKAVLLDQKAVAGVGNIYADEALHLAQIHPVRTASKLTKAQVDRLHAAVKVVISDSIDRGGTSFTHYVNVLGTRGDYLQHARVFRRQGMECRVCGGEIIKTRVAGRGTHICLICQPEPKG